MTAARAVLEHVALDSSGNVLAGQSVYVYEADGTTPIIQTMYAALTGSATRSSPLTSDSLGRVIAYTATPQRVKLGINGATYTSEFRADPADLALTSSPTFSSPTIADLLKFTENANALTDPGAGLASLRVDTSGDLRIFPTGGSELKFTKSGLIANADILGAAAIALSKLAVGAANSVVVTNGGATALTAALLLNANVDPAAAIALSKLAAGSVGLLRSDGSVISAGNQIANVDVAVAAAIALSKLAPGSAGFVKSNGSTISAGNTVANTDLTIPYQSTQVVGSTSGPTTASASYATVPEMSRTLTTVGGKLRVSSTITLSNTGAGNITTLAFSLDGAAEVVPYFLSHDIVNNFDIVHLVHTFTGVSNGSHTVTLRWKTTAGTTTAAGTQREIELEELPL
jgi:hypothetical protein